MTRNWASPFGRLLAVAFMALAFTACSVTDSDDDASVTSQRQEINAGVNATLSKLYKASPKSQDLIKKASGVLVFPSVVGGSFVVGGEYGRGALREHGVTTGYYSISSASVGFQAGAQSRALVIVFTTPQALKDFKGRDGWSVGADASVHLATVGASGDIDSSIANQPVVGFVLTNVGLSGGVSLTGSKVSPLKL